MKNRTKEATAAEGTRRQDKMSLRSSRKRMNGSKLKDRIIRKKEKRATISLL
jgi:hypothetical protein